MKRSWIPFAAAAAALFAPSARADEAPDFSLPAGEPASGEIAFDGEEDRVAVALLAGSKLSFVVKPSAASPLLCGGDVLDPSGAVAPLVSAKRKDAKGSVSIKNFAATSAAEWFVAVRGTTPGPLGAWSLTTKAKHPAKPPKATVNAAAGQSADVLFDALSGSTLTATVARGKNSSIVPRISAILAPDGSPLDLGAVGVVRKDAATSAKLSGLVLPQFGRYTLRIAGDSGTGGDVSASLSFKFPKASKTVRDFRGASGGEFGAGEPTAIEIVPGSATLAAGASRQFVAKASFADGRFHDATRLVSWSARDGSVASFSASSSGLLTAGAAGGTTAAAWRGSVEAREVLVLAGGATLSSIAIAPAAPRMASGETTRLFAIGTFSAGSDADLSRAGDWSGAGGILQSVAGGVVTAGASSGSADVGFAIGSTMSPPRTVDVSGRRIASIALSPSYAELTPGAPTRQFSALATLSDGGTADVSGSVVFKSDNLAAVTIAGRTATRAGDGTAGICAVLDGVSSPQSIVNSGPVACTGLQAISTSDDWSRDGRIALTVRASFADGGTRDATEAVNWSSNATAVAAVSNTAGAKGRITQLAATGSATITASLTAASVTRMRTLVVNGDSAPLVSVRIVPETASVPVGGAIRFRAFATLLGGAETDVSDAAVWTISNTNVATVVAGRTTGAAGGGAVLRAEWSGGTATSVVLVGAGRLASLAASVSAGGPLGTLSPVSVTPTFAPVVAGDSGTAILPHARHSADPLAVPFDRTGATGRRAATVNLAASFAGVLSADAAYVATSAQRSGLSVHPQTAFVSFLADTQLAAQSSYTDGSVADETSAATWTSLNTSRATVSSTGLLHAVATGAVDVQAAIAPRTAVSNATVLGDPPVIGSLSPNVILRGANGTTVTLTGSGFDGPSPTVSFSGTGVTVVSGPTVSGGGTQATVVVDVSAGATAGLRNVTYTTVVGANTLNNALSVTTPPPAIVSVAPTNILQPGSGSAMTTLTVTGADFQSGDILSLETHTGVSIGSTSFVSATTLTASVTVQSTAVNTQLDVTVTQPSGNGGQSATLGGALRIGPPDPVCSPSAFRPGAKAATARLTGQGFQSGVTVGFPGANGSTYAASGVTRVSSAEITFALTVQPGASLGGQTVTITNPGQPTDSYASVFFIVPADPEVASSTVKSIAPGASNVDVTIRGRNFRSGDTVGASGAGITFSSVSVVDDGTITAKAAAAGGAAAGLRDLLVSHSAGEGGRSGTLGSAFRVTSGAPTVSAIQPARLGRTGSSGATRRYPVTITGTNFSAGATVSVTRTSSSGISLVGGSVSVASDTSLTAEIDVSGGTTTGFWDVVVTNPSGTGNSGATGAAKLEIVAETTLAVNRVIEPSGTAQGGERVTVQGSGFVRGCRVEFGTERSPAVQVLDSFTLVCTVPPPADPSSSSTTTISRTAATRVDVKVTNSPAGAATSATLTNGYSYAAETSSFTILSIVPASGTTGHPKNLKSAVVRLSAPSNTKTASFSGFTSGTHCFWFEANNFFVSSITGGFGADRRFLVFSRTGGGNLPINGMGADQGRYVLETATALKTASGTPLTAVNTGSALFDQWDFTISTTLTDATAPTVSSTVPTSSATGVSGNQAVAVTFSEAVDPLTVTTTSVQLKQGVTALSCNVTLSDDVKTVTLRPTEELSASTVYTISLAGTIADLCGNTLVATTSTFTTAAADTVAPAIDAVEIADLPSSVDGSGTYVPGPDDGNGSGAAAVSYDPYLPLSGWTVVVRYSDAGNGVDTSTFSAKASVASGSSGANAELASKFTITGTEARWTISSSDALTAGDNATLSFSVRDTAGNLSSTSTVTIDLVDLNTSATGGVSSLGGDHDLFDTRETWVLRFDADAYTATFSTSGSTQQVTTTAGADGTPDIAQALRLCGLQSASMTADATAAVNGTSRGTNAIALRLFQERLRAALNVRYGIAEDGTRGAGSANIEFLLPGEKGSLASLPTWSSAPNSFSSNAFSEMDVGGDTAANASLTGTFATLGRAPFDIRNRSREAVINAAGSSGNLGVFAINIFKSTMNASTTNSAWGRRVTAKFLAAKGGTPVGEDANDDDVLAGTFVRSSGSNTQAQNDRYDAITDAIDAAALSIAGVAAHEIGHSVGLKADGGPKTGTFGNVHHTNSFTQATAGSQNTSAHLDFLGNPIMAPGSSIDDRIGTGSDQQVFDPMDLNLLRHRQVHDEGK